MSKTGMDTATEIAYFCSSEATSFSQPLLLPVQVLPTNGHRLCGAIKPFCDLPGANGSVFF